MCTTLFHISSWLFIKVNCPLSIQYTRWEGISIISISYLQLLLLVLVLMLMLFEIVWWLLSCIMIESWEEWVGLWLRHLIVSMFFKWLSHRKCTQLEFLLPLSKRLMTLIVILSCVWLTAFDLWRVYHTIMLCLCIEMIRCCLCCRVHVLKSVFLAIDMIHHFGIDTEILSCLCFHKLSFLRKLLLLLSNTHNIRWEFPYNCLLLKVWALCRSHWLLGILINHLLIHMI